MMSRERLSISFELAVLISVLGCGNVTSNVSGIGAGGSGGPGGQGGGAGMDAGVAGRSGKGGRGGAGGISVFGVDAGSDETGSNTNGLLGDPNTKGTGACSSTTLGAVIARITQSHPELAGIDQLPLSGLWQEGDYIFAWPTLDGFFLVFRRTSHASCTGSCVDREYWYFQTDSTCTPQYLGRYHEWLDQQNDCYDSEGTPMWGFPPPRTPQCPVSDAGSDGSAAAGAAAR